MKIEHLKLLKCIACESELKLSSAHPQHKEDSEIEEGVICCKKCDAVYPIIEGVGVFFDQNLYSHFLNPLEKEACARLGLTIDDSRQKLEGDLLKTKQVTDNWSYQWNETASWTADDFEKDDFRGVRLFKKFIRLKPEEYQNKKVVIWCGGNGRETYHVSRFKPSLLIVNEIGDEIYRIRRLVRFDQELLLVRCDMLKHPIKDGIADISICDHALQHVADHARGLENIARVLKPNAIAALCVYSHENNFLMTHLVEPAKHIIHRIMPLKLQSAISIFPAILIYGSIRLFYLPASKILPEKIQKKIPLFEHMIFWSTSDFKFIWMACFDLIHAPISYHFRKNEMAELARQSGLAVNKLINTHGTTWSLVANRQ